jgi:hypothetical protein
MTRQGYLPDLAERTPVKDWNCGHLDDLIGVRRKIAFNFLLLTFPKVLSCF